MSSHWHQSLICDNEAWKLDVGVFPDLEGTFVTHGLLVTHESVPH